MSGIAGNAGATESVAQSSYIVVSKDPNDKLGNAGYGEENFIAPQTMAYTVRFENDPEWATAPARWVRVYDTLDDDFDLDTFELKSFCLAGNLFTVGNGRDSFNQVVKITVGEDEVYVDARINLDRETRQITAEFMAIDPETGTMLMDVTKGLLYPNDATGRGDGDIQYSVAPKEDVENGAKLTNVAEIYFDFNDPIETPVVEHTLDSAAPVLTAFTAECGNGNTVDFTFAGSDADSGVAGYNLAWSADGAVYTTLVSVTEGSWTCEIDLQKKYFFKAQAVDNAGNASEWSEAITISQDKYTMPANYTAGKFESVEWNGTGTDYIFEISKDDFATYITVDVSSATAELMFSDPANFMKNGGFVDIAGLPAGTYRWRALNAENRNIEASGALTGAAGGANAFVSAANGRQDIFFARSSGKWGSDYAAQHMGNLVNNWSGTLERVALKGKNKIEDIFVGSEDGNILFLTDDANGDALFLDDVYTNGVTQTRLSGIDKIFAGAGDDVIDLTSGRYAYVGTGTHVHGGDGDDTIWMASGENAIFGDAGNDRLIGGANNDVIVGGSGDDRLHGGGGEDIFCFGGNFGTDTIEQLADGKVIVWFGDLKPADVTISYSGTDTVLTASTGKITAQDLHLTRDDLRFGPEGFEELYAELSARGAFAGAASQQAWEIHDDRTAPSAVAARIFCGFPAENRLRLYLTTATDDEVVAKYEVRYSTDADMKNAVSATSENNVIDIDDLDPDSTYYWQVRTVDGAGNASPWSEAASYGKSKSVIEAASVQDNAAKEGYGLANIVFPASGEPSTAEFAIGDLNGTWEIAGGERTVGVQLRADTATVSIDNFGGDWTLAGGSGSVYGIQCAGETSEIAIGKADPEMDLYSNGGAVAFEAWAFGNVGGKASLDISEFSGTVDLISGADSVEVFCALSEGAGNAETRIGTFDGTVGAVADVRSYGAFALVNGSGDAVIDIDAAAGTLDCEANDYSICVLSESTAGKSTVAIDSLSGDFYAVASEGSAYGIYSWSKVDAGVRIDEVSGVVFSHGGVEGVGLFATSRTSATIGVNEISGTIWVEGRDAFAIYANSATGNGGIRGAASDRYMAITGMIFANGSGCSYGITGNMDKYISVSGSVITGEFKNANGQFTQVGHGVAIFDGYQDLAEGSATEYEMYSAAANDTIVVYTGAKIIGDISLGGGSNALYVASGAYIYGDIDGDTLDLHLVVGGQIAQRPMIDVVTAGSLLDPATDYTITCAGLQAGSYGLIRCLNSQLDFSGTKFAISYMEETAELYGDGSGFTFTDNTTVSLAMDDNGMLNLNVEKAAAAPLLDYAPGDPASPDVAAPGSCSDLSAALNGLLDKNERGMLA